MMTARIVRTSRWIPASRPFEPEVLPRSELPIAKAGGDAMLLVELALGNVVVARRHLRLRKSRSAEKCCRKCNRRDSHGVSSFVRRLKFLFGRA